MYPTYEQLVGVSNLMWTFFKAGKLASGSVSSAKQLAMLILALRAHPTTKEMIEKQMAYWKVADVAVSKTLDFLRLWATFHFSRLLMTIDRIQRDVLGRAKVRSGNFEGFAAAVENLFLDSTLMALEEYGLPLEIARKLEAALQPDGDLDAVLERLKAIDVDEYDLTPFERRMILAVQDDL